MNNFVLIVATVFVMLAGFAASQMSFTSPRDGTGCSLKKCEHTFDPVCGSDGREHKNACLMENRACLDGIKTICVVNKGHCKRIARMKRRRPGMVCNGIQCQQGASCKWRGEEAECECYPAIPYLYRPVCGSNGKTYGNQFELDFEACMNRMNIDILHEGRC